MHLHNRFKTQFNTLCVFKPLGRPVFLNKWVKSTWPGGVRWDTMHCTIVQLYTLKLWQTFLWLISRMWQYSNANLQTQTLLYLPPFCRSLPALHKYTTHLVWFWNENLITAPFLAQPSFSVVVANTPEKCKVNLSVLLEQLKENSEKCAMPTLDFIHISLILSSSGFHAVSRICIDMQMRSVG